MLLIYHGAYKMSLIQTIKEQQLEARKTGDAQAALLTTLLSEAVNVGKNDGNRETTDAEVVAVVKKFIKNLDETIVACNTRGKEAGAFIQEKQKLETFLPQQLDEQALINIAKTGLWRGMPDFMKHLKENFAGQYDGKLASTVAKSFFN